MSFVTFAIFVCIGLIVVLGGREVACWYFKINEANDLLREIRDGLKANAQRFLPPAESP